MKTNSISFEELSNYNDSNSCVMIALIIENENEVLAMSEFLSSELGFSKGKKIVGYHHIEGNVRGKDGRSDYLLEFDHPEIAFSPLARLQFLNGQAISSTSTEKTTFYVKL